jgi:hypothetical protein
MFRTTGMCQRLTWCPVEPDHQTSSQFAYNEVSFFIIRLLQMFDHIELASDAQPPESLPPVSWANGQWRKSVEKIRPKSEVTMSVQVSLLVGR